MSLFRIDRNPSGRQLAVFGVLWLVFFGVVGHGVLRRAGMPWAAYVVWAVALGVPAVGAIVPAVLRLAFVGLSYATAPIGIVVSFLILAVIYYLVVTPTGLLMRLLGYDPLSRAFEPDMKTYWITRPTGRPTERYFRQF
jgi:hypothetical protein